MKITENAIAGNRMTEQSVDRQITKNADSSDQTRVFAGGIGKQHPLDTQLEAKRAAAMEKAKKLLSDAFTAEKSIDDDLAERTNRIKASEQAIVDANKELAGLDEEKEKLKEQYGVTGEETEEMLSAEYKMQRDELTRYKEPYQQAIEEAKKVVEEERRIIAAIEVERLKSDPMVETSKQAENILTSAKEEIAGMAVEQLQETAEEAKEKQEAAKEKAEAEETKRKEREERRKEAELSDMPVQELLNLEQVRGELKQEVDQMLVEMKLLAEDIKGSMVDEQL